MKKKVFLLFALIIITFSGLCAYAGEEIITTNVSEIKTPVTPKPKTKGCGGSIAATRIILSTLALAGLGLAISKKRKED